MLKLNLERVKLKNLYSEIRKVSCGVPQGTVLVPCYSLFL